MRQIKFRAKDPEIKQVLDVVSIDFSSGLIEEALDAKDKLQVETDEKWSGRSHESMPVLR